MLVLTRKPTQQLRIGDDIVITVVKVRGNTIRLGIEAPKDVRVIRAEIEAKDRLGADAPSGNVKLLTIVSSSDSDASSAAGNEPKAVGSTDDPATADARPSAVATDQGTSSGFTPTQVENCKVENAPLKAYNRGLKMKGRLDGVAASDSQRGQRSVSSNRISSLMV